MSESPIFGLNLSVDSQQSLYEQLYLALRQRMEDGRLVAGEQLPPSRKLAEELGVSRTTVVAAYDQLVAEGFAYSVKGSGVFVSEIGVLDDVEPRQTNSITIVPQPQASKLPLLHPGVPDSRLIPYRTWAKYVARVARTSPEVLLINNDAFGDWQLRYEICRYLREWRGVEALPQQVLITAGALEALEICIRSLIGEGDAVGLEEPGYPPIRDFVKSQGLNRVHLAMDEEGSLPPKQADVSTTPKLLILTPSSLFPLGGALPYARRKAFINWAKDTDSWLIEDDYDSEFRYAGRPIPAMAGIDQYARTLYVGSFAKIFANNLRMGFIVVPDALVSTFANTLKQFGSKASIMPQRPLAEFMKQGDYYRHIRRVRRIYAERREALIGLLNTHLSDTVSFTDHRAGMLIAVHLPDHLVDTEIAKQAEAIGLSCPALSTYFSGDVKQNGILLGFCAYTIEELDDAMKKLVTLIR